MGSLADSTQIIPIHNVTPGLDIDASSGLTGDRVNMEGFGHCTMILYSADVAAVVTYTVRDHTLVSGGTSADIVGVQHYWRKSANTNLDAVGVFTRVTNDPIVATAVSVTGEIGLLILEIRADQMADGSPFISVNSDDPALACLFSGFYILSDTRYAQDIVATALA